MWKAVAALLVSAAIIGGSVALYRNRAAFFRPDLERSGGSRFVLRVSGDAEGVAEALRKRFDPKGMGAVGTSVVGDTVRLDIPTGRNHDELVARAERLATKPGRLWAGILAEPDHDPEAAKETEAKAGKTVKAGGREYAWASISRIMLTRMETLGGRKAPSRVAETGGVSVPWPGPAGLSGGWFLLVRRGEPPVSFGSDEVRLTEDNGPMLQLALRGEGRVRLADLASRHVGGTARRLALMLDDDILSWQHLFHMPDTTRYGIIFNDPPQARDASLLLRHPFPPNASATILDKIEFPTP